MYATLAPCDSNHTCPTPSIEPTNHVLIQKRSGGVRDIFIINPWLGFAEDAANLRVGTENGAINVDVLIHDDSAATSETREGSERRHTVLVADTVNGSVSFRVQDPTVRRHAPLDIAVTTMCGDVLLCLPRSFNGLIVATAGGCFSSVLFSEILQSHTITFKNIGGYRRSFVGNSEQWLRSREAWEGDRAHVTTSLGNVKIAYIDEQC